MSVDTIQRRTKPHRGWGLLIGAVLVLVLLCGVDEWMKRSSAVGFCPANAQYIAAAEDFGHFFDGLLKSDAGTQFTRTVPKQIINYELAIRQFTGIRPTPLRWRTWMGRTFLAATAKEGTGMCVRPGLLMRFVHAAHRVVAQPAEGNGLYAFGPVFYAWREGFLIVSSSAEYVTASLGAPPPTIEQSESPNELRVHVLGKRPAVLRVRGENGMPVSGWLTGSLKHRPDPIALDAVWPEDTLISMGASKVADLAEFIQALYGPLATLAIAGRNSGESPVGIALAQQWASNIIEYWQFPAPPEGWEARVDECAIALMGIDNSSTTPVPELAMTMRSRVPVEGRHPLEFLAAGVQSRPYEWDTVRGLLIPWLGERLTLCLAGAGNDWLATSHEPLMARLLRSRNETQNPVSLSAADAMIHINWKSVSEPVTKLLTNAADLELIPYMNRKDVEANVIPFVQAVAEFGSLRIDGHSEQERIRIEGWLAVGGNTGVTTKR